MIDRRGGAAVLLLLAGTQACDGPRAEDGPAEDDAPPAAVPGAPAEEAAGGPVPGAAGEVRFEAPAGVPGDLFLEGGVLRFRPCGSGGAQPVDDGTDGEAARAVRELGYGDGLVHAVVVLDGSRLTELRYALPEAAGCENVLPEAEVEARGNEPFWSVRISGPEARWSSPDDADGHGFDGGVWERPAEDRWRFRARSDGAGTEERLTLELVETRCRDTMAGAYFPYEARVELGSRTFRGCALEGAEARTIR